MQPILSIAIGAVLGASLRWKLGEHTNHLFPTIPMGTLIANLLGAFLMGAFMFMTTKHSFLSYEVRLGIVTGFLGSLTTFSTFSAEALELLSRQELLWLAALIILHVGGSIFIAATGYFFSKFIYQMIGVY